MPINELSNPFGRRNDNYDIDMDHSMDGVLDGQDVDSYIDQSVRGGPKSSQDLLNLQASGCDIDAQDLKDFVTGGGNLTGRNVLSFIANGGKVTEQDIKDLQKDGVKFDSKQMIIMESAMQVDLNGDGKMAGPHVAREYLSRHETPRPGDGYDSRHQYLAQHPGGIPNGYNGGIPYANPLDYNYQF